MRKKDKLPFDTIAQEYDLEYGTDTVEIHTDAIKPGDRILVVDDLIATGGTAVASIELIRQAGGEIVGCSFIVDLPDLGGRAKIEALDIPILTLCEFEGD